MELVEKLSEQITTEVNVDRVLSYQEGLKTWKCITERFRNLPGGWGKQEYEIYINQNCTEFKNADFPIRLEFLHNPPLQKEI